VSKRDLTVVDGVHWGRVSDWSSDSTLLSGSCKAINASYLWQSISYILHPWCPSILKGP
jgi:hypothetical protein